jgi:APA family basic amino acid/polyamine antiporter
MADQVHVPQETPGPATESSGGKGAPQFGLTAAMALIVGSIIGVGVFNLPTSLAGYGPITLVSMALTTVGALALAMLFAALSRRLPADGGPYAYARSGSSGMTVITSSRSNPAWSWPTNATPAPTPHCARPASR